MSRCGLDLWPVDLESLWYIKRHMIKVLWNLSVIEQSLAELLIILRIFAHAMSRCDLWPLTSLSWTFTALRVSCVQTLYKIWAKSNNSRLSYWRFSTVFSPCNFKGWGTTDRLFSGVRGLNFTKLGRGMWQLFLHEKCVSDFRSLAAFSNASGSAEWCWKRRQISHFSTPCEN